jgi:hypothetical protein
MTKTAQRLWADTSAVITTTDLILISTILVIGLIVGLTTLRDQVVQELGDLGAAVGSLNQSYSVAEFTTANFSAAGYSFADTSDDCEAGTMEGDPGNDVAGEPPLCIAICSVPATPEGT